MNITTARSAFVTFQVSLILGVLFLPSPTCSLVTSAGASSDPLAASRLRQQLLLEALSPPSGKLSISPELSIQESTDPTAILLQSNAIKVLSERLRSVAKANSVWISGSLTTLQTFCAEQELARGKIPGPIPVVYCGSGVVAAAADPSIVENINGLEYLHSVATAGAHGIVIPILEGLPVTSLDQIVANEWVATCQQALTCGLVPIPEITLREDAAKTWKEEDVATLVDRLAQIGGIELASMLLTVQNSEDATNADASSDKEQALSPSSSSSLPPISKELRRKVPIIGSVRVAAGENRMGMETARFKNAGYSGTLLRHECVPESLRYSKNIDLMGRFWTNCIGDLKSTRSKAFNFRAKNNMEKSHTEMWANYMKEVSESGAMGNESDATGPPVDATSGEYRGFA